MSKHSSFNVLGMSCSHCVSRINKALSINGISSVSVSLKNNTVDFDYDDSILDINNTAQEAIQKAGFKVNTDSY